jgi:hypothetical protein
VGYNLEGNEMYSSTLSCHWCGVNLSMATQITYLNGSLPCCDLCLQKSAKTKSAPIRWQQEDELPPLSQADYDDMYPMSIVPDNVGCRIFSYVDIDGEKYYLMGSR